MVKSIMMTYLAKRNGGLVAAAPSDLSPLQLGELQAPAPAPAPTGE